MTQQLENLIEKTSDAEDAKLIDHWTWEGKAKTIGGLTIACLALLITAAIFFTNFLERGDKLSAAGLVLGFGAYYGNKGVEAEPEGLKKKLFSFFR